MRIIGLVAVAGSVSGCWYERKPVAPRPVASGSASAPSEAADQAPDTPSYRAMTIASDAIGVAAMTLGLVGLSRGGNEDLHGGLLVGGFAIAGFGAPVIHLSHGRKGRAGASYLMRSLTTTMGTLAGATAGCGDHDQQLFCGLEGMMWGAAAGLALAGITDALFLHREYEAQTWAPTMTVNDGSVRLGIVAPL